MALKSSARLPLIAIASLRFLIISTASSVLLTLVHSVRRISLADRSFVNPARIGVIGFSQGGGVALSVAEERFSVAFVNPAQFEFRAAIAFYPPCAFAGGKPKLPTLILTGAALDDWTQTAPARSFYGAVRNHLWNS
jgi:dienelactone hydrolase